MGKKILNPLKKIDLVCNIADLAEVIIDKIPENPVEKITEFNEKRKDQKIINNKKDKIRDAEKQITRLEGDIIFKKGNKLKLEKDIKYCTNDKKKSELEAKLLNIEKDLEYYEERKIQWKEYKKTLEENLD